MTNTGNYAAKEVVQLYVSNQTWDVNRPEKELKGFVKLALAPGQTAVASFELDERNMSGYNEQAGDWYAASGQYEILFAHSSRDVRVRTVVQWKSQRIPPLRVERNTTVSELMKYPAAAKILEPLLKKEQASEEKTEVAREAITQEMTRQIMLNSPLRRLQVNEGESDEWLDQLVCSLQSAVSTY